MKAFYGDTFRWWMGVVINVAGDPLQLGRALVRIDGIHGPDIPDAKLPWASVVAPTTSGGVSGVGTNPMLKPGARVVGWFIDGAESQFPVIWGSIPNVEGVTMSVVPDGGLRGAPRPTGGGGTNGPAYTPPANPNYTAPGYPPDMTTADIENIIREEAALRGIDGEVAVRIFRHEGAGSYQSSVSSGNQMMRGGREASYGPYQLYVGGGLGNEYEERTGRNLVTDNTREGITNQIRFSLDAATRSGGWQPWYGRGPAGVGAQQGLAGARAINNWN
jgi:hypothetical protein